MYNSSNDNYSPLDLLIHDFSLYGEFTDETEVKVFGPRPDIPKKEGKAQDEAKEAAAERMAEIKCMLERMPDFISSQQAKGTEENKEDEKSDPSIFEGNDISPIIVDKIYGNPVDGITLRNVFGEPPAYCDSPDNDARIDAWNDLTAFCCMAKRAEEQAELIVQEARKAI